MKYRIKKLTYANGSNYFTIHRQKSFLGIKYWETLCLDYESFGDDFRFFSILPIFSDTCEYISLEAAEEIIKEYKKADEIKEGEVVIKKEIYKEY